jgi:hypothetical protein
LAVVEVVGGVVVEVVVVEVEVAALRGALVEVAMSADKPGGGAMPAVVTAAAVGVRGAAAAAGAPAGGREAICGCGGCG